MAGRDVVAEAVARADDSPTSFNATGPQAIGEVVLAQKEAHPGKDLRRLWLQEAKGRTAPHRPVA